jgi:peptidoglycan/LPS O-acetylase OafA/YrhL
MKKLDQLTFTRFLAAVSVVIYHGGRVFYPFNTFPINPLFTSGSTAVGYFFVLSGFVMSLVYYRPETKFNFKGFWLARFSRIYPIYLVSFLLTCIHYADIIANSSTKKYLAGLLLYQAWIPDYALSFNFPAWSLSIEVFFYLVFPFIAILMARSKLPIRGWIWLSMGLWVISQFVLYGLSARLPHTTYVVNLLSYFPPVHLSAFLLGAVGGMWYVSVGQHNPSNQTVTRLLLILGLGLISAGLISKGSVSITITKGLLAPFFLLVVLALAMETTVVSRMLSHPWLVRLGDASYGVYILHMPVRWVYDDILKLAHIRLYGSAAFYLYAVILVALALLLYVWVERPARDWLRTNSRKLWLIFGDVLLLAGALIASFALRVGTEIRGYADPLNFALRMGIPAYLLLLILFRFYSPISANTLFSWVKRSLLPVISIGAALLAGMMFFALKMEWIGTFPRSMLAVNLLLSAGFLFAFRYVLQRWKPALVG